MDEAGDREGGRRSPWPRASSASTSSRTPAELAGRAGGAPAPEGVARGLRLRRRHRRQEERRLHRPALARAASACPTATTTRRTTSSRRSCATSTWPTWRRCSSSSATPAEAAQAHAATVMALETRLAKASMTLVELRDPNAIYNKLTRAAAREQAPGFDWEAYLAAAGLPAAAAGAARAPARLLPRARAPWRKDVPLADWKTYLRWHLIHATAARARRALRRRELRLLRPDAAAARRSSSPRWKRVQAVDRRRPRRGARPALRRAGVLPRGQGARPSSSCSNLQRRAAASASRTLAWMSEPTKQKALQRSSTRSSSRSATPTSGATTPRSRSPATPTSGTSWRRNAFEVAAATRPSSASRRPHRVADDAADRQRLLRARP